MKEHAVSYRLKHQNSHRRQYKFLFCQNGNIYESKVPAEERLMRQTPNPDQAPLSAALPFLYPLHMLRNMGDEETLILYNSYYDIDFKDRRRITPIARHVYVLDLYYYRKYLLNALKQIEKKYVMVYSTDTVPVSRKKQYSELGFRIIYEYVDDINEELISRKKIAQIRSRHQYLLRAKNVLTVATADKLYKEAK